MKQLTTGDRSAQMKIAQLLGKVGTEKQLQPLEALALKVDPNLRKRLCKSIDEIKSRLTKR
jgi:hypothetical protein